MAVHPHSGPAPRAEASGAAFVDDFAAARERMVRTQLLPRGVRDARVLGAMRRVPRERFVPELLRADAYEDEPLPIGARQTISQPYIVAYMLEAAELQPSDRVLDVGTGSGYAAALASLLVHRVDSVERIAILAHEAQRRLSALRYENVDVHIGDGSAGWPAAAPYDAILVAAGAPRVPRSLELQLAPGGRLILPVGESGHAQRLLRVRRLDAVRFEREDLGGVTFVPLVGEQGWEEGEG